MDFNMQLRVLLMFFICSELSIVLTECSNNAKCSLGTTKIYFLRWWLELRVYVGGGGGVGDPGGGGGGGV